MLSIKLSLLIGIVKILDRVYLSTGTPISIVRDWVREVERRVSTRGPVDTIAWIKHIRLCCTRYLAGAPLATTPALGIELDSTGLPKGVPIVELVRERDPPKVRLLLTLLGISRVLPGWKAPDLTPIITPSSSNCTSLGAELVAVVRELGWKLVVPKWERCHVSTKSGPNAQALVGSVEDAHLLTKPLLTALEVVGGQELIRTIETIRLISPLAWLEKIASLVPSKDKKGKFAQLAPKGRLGRLSLIKDKEAKCRIVAILDYWTQTALKPLHDEIFSFLRGLRPDCTFNQGSFKSKLPRKGPYYSFDLSSATDRLPVVIQQLVLGELLSREFAAAWGTLIIARDYVISWGNRKDTVRYACGQPMGAYSSWAVFALCHHVIVRLAAKRAGLTVSFTGYVLLGDDIVLTNSAVAEQYRLIISELGVEISDMKTHVSNDTYEFAKRWIHRGVEVTGAPLGSLFEGIRLAGRDIAIKFPGQKRRHNIVDLAKQDPKSYVRYVSFWELTSWMREVEARWLSRSDMLVSRGLFAELLCALYADHGYASRLAGKAWRLFLLPSREDGRRLRRTKSQILASILFSEVLTCATIRTHSHEVVMAYLIEAKARVLENAIKRQVQSYHTFQLELRKWTDLLPEGLDAQSLLLSLPPLAVIRSAIASLQLEIDKIYHARHGAALNEWLHLEIRLFVDPWQTISTRTSKVVASNKATIANMLPPLVAGLLKLRNVVYAGNSEEEVARVLKAARSGPIRFQKQGRKRNRGSSS